MLTALLLEVVTSYSTVVEYIEPFSESDLAGVIAAAMGADGLKDHAVLHGNHSAAALRCLRRMGYHNNCLADALIDLL